MKTFYARSSGNISGVKDAVEGPFYSNGPLIGSLLNQKPYWFAECGIGGYALTDSWYEPSAAERAIIYNHAVAAAGIGLPTAGDRHTLIVQLLFFRKETQSNEQSQVKLARLFVYDCEIEGYIKAIKCSCDPGGPDEVFINRSDLP
ncbi:MAG: hypothetical protein HC888_01375 [Candidatus Competibacteraceae bacterium]|nr:hypothetical protein [Candidatus Competibacteraceae bacterium]